ncbi:hypothetical protein BO82DRAFT_380674 [Aspergillus uvarum CBS 121591]|uniref:Viral A-type inclusion protein repeat protein n=1 Tax=Aspergillus uvarum CBS 121591 TaxID=1448315 RepID=A0A319CJZ4_9EURO|nr:hypothetical protein BO82DRAFT_380674 [Aspergillus uvarum CBS 121591]PYH85554.1 hypothetical protein BO82DRAFT_380674 [Aspergillus uvarum CBS 121591]
MAHSRVLSIEPFEAALRENTPLTSIGEPKALTEYLNQLSLKGDMVLEELKRVTTERDDYKKKLEEAQKATKAALDEVAQLKAEKESKEKASDANESVAKSEEKSTRADTAVTTASPKKSAEHQGDSEEFFSYDSEIPRLESELKEKQEEIESMKTQMESLKRELAVARESTEGMVHNLESATRELTELRDFKDKQDTELEKLKSSKQGELDDLKAKLEKSEEMASKTSAEIEKLKSDLTERTEEIKKLQAQASPSPAAGKDADLTAKLEKMEQMKEANEKRLSVLQGLVDSLRSQLKESEEAMTKLKADAEQKKENNLQLQNVVDFLDTNLESNVTWQLTKEQIIGGKQANFDELRESLAPSSSATEAQQEPTETAKPAANPPSAAGSSKKKNKKKKKGGAGGAKGGEEASKATEADRDPSPSAEPASAQLTAKVAELEESIDTLKKQLDEKDAAIDRLSSKLKGEEDLKEEIESLRDDLLHIGQEHVESKDKVKVLTAEKQALEGSIAKLEKELTDLRTNIASHASQSADSEKAHNDLKEEYENIKIKLTTLETELSAAQQLAATRFKDITDLRETLQKLQPELKKLRAESSELKSTKDSLTSKTNELRTLESKHDDLRAELKTLKSTVSEREKEVKTLNNKIKQETDSRLRAEEKLTVAQSDLRYSESKKQEATEAKEKVTSELSKTQGELKTARARLRESESQASQINKELQGLREEIQLKTAQHASAQSLMNSMRDQAAELGMQMKEARERCESLEEELADAHRLLSERTREGETMRRLLNDIESRTDAKVRDFKERMEAAIEERDRAEDEASAQGRRRARELEDLKSKLREAERALRSADQDKEELEQTQKDWKRRRDQLEAESEKTTQELVDLRQAMAGLRDSLDESEKQVRDLEKEKAELRRSVEETNSRLEKMRKSNKLLPDEGRFGHTAQSSRSSIDSGSRRTITSPIAKEHSPSTRSGTPTGVGAGSIDYIYLKNVLLQFLEQKDKNYQKQLIPVLGMLLHFDRVGLLIPSLTMPSYILTDRSNADVPIILQFIRELADYEKALHEVEATEESLLATLSFPDSTPKRGSVYTALVIPPATAEQPNPLPVGMALFFYNYSTWRSAPGIYLEDLYVQPSARGNGYGFKLLKYLAAKVLEVNGRRLEWSVLKWNEPSIKFYEQVGAKAMDEWTKMMMEGPALNKLAEGI